jgi:hypothetical protein
MGSKRAGERCARSSSRSKEPSESPHLPLITPFVERKPLARLQMERALIFYKQEERECGSWCVECCSAL